MTAGRARSAGSIVIIPSHSRSIRVAGHAIGNAGLALATNYMALERKDIRAKMDPDEHRALTVIAESEGMDIAAFVERELLEIVRRRVHAANVISTGTANLVISGISGSRPGKP